MIYNYTFGFFFPPFFIEQDYTYLCFIKNFKFSTMTVKKITKEQVEELLTVMKKRFETNANRHSNIEWAQVQSRLEKNQDKIWSLNEMETTGGEPDVIGEEAGKYLFVDCSTETPKGRRSLCYDREALDARKEFKPANSVVDLANSMEIELLDETQYRYLQTLGNFDNKTSSWLKTPDNIRKLGVAIFGDYRYGNVFIYHNGAESYYAARGFRGLLRV